MNDLRIWALPGLPEIRAGHDLAKAVVDAAQAYDRPLLAGDVVVVSSKIVAKAEGRLGDYPDRESAVAGETVRVVAHRRTPRGLTVISRSRSGPVLAAAGVDASNVPDGQVLPLPLDPDASARRLRSGLMALVGVPLGVVLSDTLGRPWREGQTDAAVGAAGIHVLDDLRGRTDREGRVLDVTVRALADELAAAADLVKGKVEGLPVAVVRGRPEIVGAEDGPGAAVLTREDRHDWFRLGTLEAVEEALGAAPGSVPAAPAGPVPWLVALERSVHLALGPARQAGLSLEGIAAEVAGDGAALLRHQGGLLDERHREARLAVATERLLTALQAHGHRAEAVHDVGADGAAVVRVAPAAD
ncbi:MAG: coenzyme F420-0:L-glutamate ligase [Kineosporiaceae bacterium]